MVLLAGVLAAGTGAAGVTAFAAENTEGTKAEGGNITIAVTSDPRTSTHFMLWTRQVLT